jgi:hypothetical protein
VVEITTVPPPLPPPKNPPKKPPPKPKPPDPPITATSLAPAAGAGMGGKAGKGIGTIASCCCTGAAQAAGLVITRRIFFIGRGPAGVERAILRFIALGWTRAAGPLLACLTY